MDIGGTSDPYVKVYVLPDKKKKFCTKKLKKTLNPVYNETFTFQKLPYNEMENRTLVFSIYDHDALGADDQIGEACIPLAAIDLAADDLTLWRDIKEPPKNVLGDICISLRYKPQRLYFEERFTHNTTIDPAVNRLCSSAKSYNAAI